MTNINSMTNILKIILFVFLVFSCSTNQKEVDNVSDIPISPTDFDAQADIRKGDIHLIQYGLIFPFPERDSLTKLFGFYYQDRGCIVSDTINKLTDTYNEQIIKHLSKRNGSDWYKKFSLIADSLQGENLKSL
jgi:hypothetical protein